jgi:cell shape-determining protein MreD
MVKEEMKDNSAGVAGVVFGILGIIFGGLLGWLGIIFGVIGLFFSLNQKKHGKNKWSKIGFTLNVIAIVLGIVALIFAIYIVKQHPELLAKYTGVA